MLGKRLTSEGYSVITATNGTNAIALAKSQHPDIIILDMLLPDIHVGEVTAILKAEEQTKDIPIIFLSGFFSKAEEAKKGHLINGQTMFAKPYDVQELRNAIEELIREKKTFLRSKKQPSQDIKILIVDDERDFLHTLGSRLRASGYGVAFAVDGLSAITVAKEEKPDLIILDIGLPAGDGFYVMQRLSALAQTAFIPVIIATGQDDPAVKKRALEAGARAFLQKPIDKDELLDAIEKVFADQKAY
jgi:DNA-binding response OmpR family regulator